jgi:hypothetical protein
VRRAGRRVLRPGVPVGEAQIKLPGRHVRGCHPRVSDNLKTGVIRADLYDPLLNRAYAEMAEHYGCLIDPAPGSQAKGTSPGSSDSRELRDAPAR